MLIAYSYHVFFSTTEARKLLCAKNLKLKLANKKKNVDCVRPWVFTEIWAHEPGKCILLTICYLPSSHHTLTTLKWQSCIHKDDAAAATFVDDVEVIPPHSFILDLCTAHNQTSIFLGKRNQSFKNMLVD